MKHIFIINPVSGHQDALKLIPWIESYFSTHPLNHEIHITQYPGHATLIAQQYHVEDDVTLYACGGDGTANEVLNGCAPGVAMAIIPSGTGNDFFRMISSKKTDLKRILIDTIEGKEVWVDHGTANQKAYMDSSTLGFDADVGVEANRIARFKWIPSKLVYLTAVFKILAKRSPKEVVIDMNNTTLKTNALIVAVMNGQFYGGGFLPTPMASIQDGNLDVCVIQDTDLKNILRLLPKYMKGTHIDEPIVSFYKTQAIRIQCKEPVNIQTDGEVTQNTILDVRIEKQALKMRVPRSSTLVESV